MHVAAFGSVHVVASNFTSSAISGPLHFPRPVMAQIPQKNKYTVDNRKPAAVAFGFQVAMMAKMKVKMNHPR